VRKRIEAIRREKGAYYAGGTNSPACFIFIRNESGHMSKLFGHVGAPWSRKTRAK
jgi:hypothetical protein